MNIKKVVKKYIKGFLRSLGLRVSFINKGELSEEKKIEWLKNIDFKTIIDVGASKGNFSLQFHKIFPSAQIYAFEPLSDCFELTKKKLVGVADFKAFNLALSDLKGQTKFFRSSYSGASSLIKMASLQKELFPVTAGETVENIQVDTMDNIFNDINLTGPILIKLDVQGTEDKVIVGGGETFSKAKAVITETSFRRLYEGQPLFSDINRQLEALGFRYVGIWGEGDFKSPVDGQPLQQDSIFIRE